MKSRVKRDRGEKLFPKLGLIINPDRVLMESGIPFFLSLGVRQDV